MRPSSPSGDKTCDCWALDEFICWKNTVPGEGALGGERGLFAEDQAVIWVVIIG